MADVRRSPFLTSTVLYDVNSTWNNSFDVSADPMEGFPYPSLYSWTRIVLASVTVTVIMAATGLLLKNGLIDSSSPISVIKSFKEGSSAGTVCSS